MCKCFIDKCKTVKKPYHILFFTESISLQQVNVNFLLRFSHTFVYIRSKIGSRLEHSLRSKITQIIWLFLHNLHINLASLNSNLITLKDTQMKQYLKFSRIFNGKEEKNVNKDLNAAKGKNYVQQPGCQTNCGMSAVLRSHLYATSHEQWNILSI